MAAKSHSTLHVALHRNEEPIVRNAALCERFDDNSHHDFGTNDERDCSLWVKFDTGDQRRNRANRCPPAVRCRIDRQAHIDSAFPPTVHFAPIKKDVGGSSAAEQKNPSIPTAACHQGVEDRTQRRQADATRNQYDIVAFGKFGRPCAAERASQSDR
jgi:hypothetical protein